ncbi:hypothetical protein ACVV2G_28455 [Streptomyces ziwulingensis]
MTIDAVAESHPRDVPTIEHIDFEALDGYRFADGEGFPCSYRDTDGEFPIWEPGVSTPCITSAQTSTRRYRWCALSINIYGPRPFDVEPLHATRI